MKKARFLDHWRHVYSNAYPNRIDKFEIRTVPSLGDGHVEFMGGIHAICGQNGSGKSTLVNCIGALVSTPFDALPTDFVTKVKRGILSTNLHTDNVESTVTYDLSNGISNHSPTFQDLVMIDVPRRVPMILNWVRSTRNFEEMLESLEPRTCEKTERAAYSYVVGRRYEEVKIYELEDIPELDTIPHFELRSRGATYSTPHMGLGEFSIFYLVWLLGRVKKMSMVLIEEPESFISPRSQEALVNYLSKMSDEKKLWILISTHSEHVLENIPPEHINVLDPSNPTASIQKVKGQDRYLQVLGLAPRKRGALLFEDSCGTALAKLIYSHFGSSIPKTYDFVCLGGDTNVVSVLERLKSDGFTLRLAGVLDGDKRAQANTSRCKWPVLFLPGGDPPDQALYECARDSVTSFSEKIGKPEEDVTQMIAQVEGLDHHDAIIELARTLDVTYEQMLFALFLVWIADENNARLANQFLTDTNQALKE